MRSVTVSWDSVGSRFTALGTHRGQEIVINAPRLADQHAAPTGFSATELLLASAGSCAAWDVVEIIRKRRHTIRGLTVTVEGEQIPDPPWTYSAVNLHFRIESDDMRVPVMQRVVRLSCLRYCSVITTIAATAHIGATVELVKAVGTTTGRIPVDLSVAPRATKLVVDEPLADEEPN